MRRLSDGEVESSGAEEQAENSGRERWTTVEQLRRNDMAAMERQNAAAFANMGHGPGAGPEPAIPARPIRGWHQPLHAGAARG